MLRAYGIRKKMSIYKQVCKKTIQGKAFSDLAGIFSQRVEMRPYVTMRIGGPAKALYIPKQMSDLIGLILLCKRYRISLLTLGNGSNMIVSDKGTRKIFVKLGAPFFKKAVVRGQEITCGAGLSLNRFCDIAEKNSLSGAEFLVGIPGTIGGAIIQNAGAHKKEISGILKQIRCIDLSGNLVTLDLKEADFGYRFSGIKGLLIVSATFALKKSNRAIIQERTIRHIEARLSTQDYTAPSAGCVFKNPANKKSSAGALIDKCGLKGARIGDAMVSHKHANFIVNKGKATAKDVLELIQLIKKKVGTEEGVILEQEIEVIV